MIRKAACAGFSKVGIAYIVFFVLSSALLPAQNSARRIAAVEHGIAVRSGNFVYVSGLLATDQNGNVPESDSKAQCERILARAGEILAANGSSLANVAHVMVYLRSRAEYRGMNQALIAGWPNDPPARTTVMVDGFAQTNAVAEMSFIAVVNGAERKVITPEAWKPMAYSYAIQSGDTLFLAGLVSRDPAAGTNVNGDITAQTKKVMENGAAVLAAAGMNFHDVVSSRLYIGDAAPLEPLDAVYGTYFTNSAPPRTVVKTGFPVDQYLLELSLIAVKGGAQHMTPSGNGNSASSAQAGNQLYIGGATGNAGKKTSDATAQTRDMLGQVGQALVRAKFKWSDLSEATLYVRDAKDIDAVNQAYRKQVSSGPQPTVLPAPGVDPNALLEAAFTASKK